MKGCFESVEAQVASSVTYTAVQRVTESPWMRISGGPISQFDLSEACCWSIEFPILVGIPMKIVDTFLVRFNCRERVVDFGPYNAENELLRFSRQAKPFSTRCTDI